MRLTKSELQDIITKVATETAEIITEKLAEKYNIKPVNQKSAYQKTEQLLYSYNDFKRVVEERKKEIEDIRKYGVARYSNSIVEYVPHGTGTVHGITLEEESVESAVHAVQASVQGTVRAIHMIDRGMDALKNDPYYKILEMRYFEGRTQEDIAAEFKCSQQAISKNKNRLVKELSIKLFPDQVVEEYIRG